MNDMIHTDEAAAMLGMTPRYFRTRFCDHHQPGLPIIESRGATGRRRILLRRSDVEALIESMTVRPAGIRPEKGAAVLVQKATRDGP